MQKRREQKLFDARVSLRFCNCQYGVIWLYEHWASKSQKKQKKAKNWIEREKTRFAVKVETNRSTLSNEIHVCAVLCEKSVCKSICFLCLVRHLVSVFAVAEHKVNAAFAAAATAPKFPMKWCTRLHSRCGGSDLRSQIECENIVCNFYFFAAHSPAVVNMMNRMCSLAVNS